MVNVFKSGQEGRPGLSCFFYGHLLVLWVIGIGGLKIRSDGLFMHLFSLPDYDPWTVILFVADRGLVMNLIHYR
jgi:hypothetical protein